jgi:hypothetical protein
MSRCSLEIFLRRVAKESRKLGIECHMRAYLACSLAYSLPRSLKLLLQLVLHYSQLLLACLVTWNDPGRWCRRRVSGGFKLPGNRVRDDMGVTAAGKAHPQVTRAWLKHDHLPIDLRLAL